MGSTCLLDRGSTFFAMPSAASNSSGLCNLPTGEAHENIATLDDFVKLMFDVRNSRRSIVNTLMHGSKISSVRTEIQSGNYLAFFESAKRLMENGTVDFKKSLFFSKSRSDRDDRRKNSVSSDIGPVTFDIEDEIRGMKQDITFLSFVMAPEARISEFIENGLAPYHPRGKDAFCAELDHLDSFLEKLCKVGVDITVTDWDGTQKNYCSTYCTNMEPAYSGFSLSRFFGRHSKLSAILTAGPLKDLGILDLMCIPEGLIVVGGSWGNEWLLKNGDIIVNEEIFANEDSKAALKDLEQRLQTSVLKRPDFAPFASIGSGFQKKLDRVTLGFQTVAEDIPKELSQDYIDSVKAEVGRIPNWEELFAIHVSEYDMEVILKNPACPHSFNKADGIDFLLRQFNLNLSDGIVLLCGDTISDIPMVERSKAVNPNGTFAVFVDPAPNVLSSLQSLLPAEQFCVVSCPEVIHASMAKLDDYFN